VLGQQTGSSHRDGGGSGHDEARRDPLSFG
jgi:hypothetical protein